MNKYLGVLLALGLVVLPVTGVALSGCVSTGGEQGLETLETMSEADYQRLKLYSTLGVKIAANRLVQEGTVSAEDLTLAADLIESIKSTPVQGGAELLIEDILVDSGLNSTEVEALLQIVVFELQARGLFDNLGAGGLVQLSPRTSDFIDAMVEAVSSAGVVTQQEFEEAHAMGIRE
jgi:hypothetical protein